MDADLKTLIASIGAAIVGSLITYFLNSRNKARYDKPRIAIIDDNIVFGTTVNDPTAKKLLKNNDGNGFYLAMNIAALDHPASFSKAKLIIQLKGRETCKLVCKVMDPSKLVRLREGESEWVTFIADASPYGKHPEDIIARFVGGVYSLYIFNERSPKESLLEVRSRSISDIHVPDAVDKYQITVSDIADKDELDRVYAVLRSAKVTSIETREIQESDVKNVIAFKKRAKIKPLASSS